MSGGSWDYAYAKLDEIATRLIHSREPERRALGERMAPMAKAMHAIEWVDSCDWAKGDEIEPVRAALGEDPDRAIGLAARERLAEEIKRAQSVLDRLPRQER